MKSKIWLRRNIQPYGPYLCLCLSDKEFGQAIKPMGIKTTEPYVSPGKSGTTHTYENKGDLACVVCIDPKASDNINDIIGLIVHEAVHVWQQYIDGINENHPGIEQEAYGIQNISQILIEEFIRKTRIKLNAKLMEYI